MWGYISFLWTITHKFLNNRLAKKKNIFILEIQKPDQSSSLKRINIREVMKENERFIELGNGELIRHKIGCMART